MQRWLSRFVVLIMGCLFGVAAQAGDMAYAMSSGLDDFHLICLYTSCAIGLFVFSVLIYSSIKHRKSKGKTAIHFHKHLGVELLWTTIPFLILLALVLPAAW